MRLTAGFLLPGFVAPSASVRLTQIKLAGFKSFVDPSTVSIPGQLVGVVGPNGCGKSNIIDAVRWVLGESRASALRGDSMQDVIFNGSSLRKRGAVLRQQPRQGGRAVVPVCRDLGEAGIAARR